ncbi:hypothetical protein DMENIID0001_129210 [Sergentomyia squamirostris]
MKTGLSASLLPLPISFSSPSIPALLVSSAVAHSVALRPSPPCAVRTNKSSDRTTILRRFSQSVRQRLD